MAKFNMKALLNDKSKSEIKDKRVFTIQHIDINKIAPDERNFYSVDDVTELKESISLLGLQQNLVVKENQEQGNFTLISGHRRLKALKELIEEGNDEFSLVPCKVETDIDEVKSELALIFANATSRELNDYEKTRQAMRMKELLTALKQSGVALKGRLRNIVAETLNISTSKVARMEAIESNLSPEFKEEFKNESINISTAYELSGLPKEKQEEIHKEFKEKGSIKSIDVKANKEEAKKKPKPIKIIQQEIQEEKKPEEIKLIPEEEKQEPESINPPLKIYMCSAYQGIKENYIKAVSYCKEIAAQGHTPFASHVMLHGIFNDLEDREKGIAVGLAMISLVDELWFYGEEVTEGMEREIEEAKRLGKKVVYMGVDVE